MKTSKVVSARGVNQFTNSRSAFLLHWWKHLLNTVSHKNQAPEALHRQGFLRFRHCNTSERPCEGLGSPQAKKFGVLKPLKIPKTFKNQCFGRPPEAKFFEILQPLRNFPPCFCTIWNKGGNFLRNSIDSIKPLYLRSGILCGRGASANFAAT